MTTASPARPAVSETVRVVETTVACDGGGGALGHPMVYLKIGAAGAVTCPYCSRRFELDAAAPVPSAH